MGRAGSGRRELERPAAPSSRSATQCPKRTSNQSEARFHAFDFRPKPFLFLVTFEEMQRSCWTRHIKDRPAVRSRIIPEGAALPRCLFLRSCSRRQRDLFEKGKKAVDAAKDVDMGVIQVCSVCGYTLEGDAPDTCPLCKAKKEKFIPFE